MLLLGCFSISISVFVAEDVCAVCFIADVSGALQIKKDKSYLFKYTLEMLNSLLLGESYKELELFLLQIVTAELLEIQ